MNFDDAVIGVGMGSGKERGGGRRMHRQLRLVVHVDCNDQVAKHGREDGF